MHFEDNPLTFQRWKDKKARNRTKQLFTRCWGHKYWPFLLRGEVQDWVELWSWNTHSAPTEAQGTHRRTSPAPNLNLCHRVPAEREGLGLCASTSQKSILSSQNFKRWKSTTKACDRLSSLICARFHTKRLNIGNTWPLTSKHPKLLHKQQNKRNLSSGMSGSQVLPAFLIATHKSLNPNSACIYREKTNLGSDPWLL